MSGPFDIPNVILFPSDRLYCITDLGEEEMITSVEDGIAVTLPRYGVWRSQGGDVIEVNDDLQYLQQKYNVPSSQVYSL